MPVWSSEQQVRNNIADCLCFVLLIAGPQEDSPSIAIGFAESCHQSPATHTLQRTRLRDSTWNTRKSFLACRQSWFIGRATEEIHQSNSDFKIPVLSVPCSTSKSHHQCPYFFFSHFQQHKEQRVPRVVCETVCYLLLPKPFSQDLVLRPCRKPLTYNVRGNSCY